MKRMIMICGIVGCMSNIYAMNERSNQQLGYSFKNEDSFLHPHVDSVLIAPDNKTLLSISRHDKSVMVKRIGSRETPRRITYNEVMAVAAISSDSVQAAIARNGHDGFGFAILDLIKGEKPDKFLLPECGCDFLAFTSDDKKVIAVDPKLVCIVDVATGNVERKIERRASWTAACFIKGALLTALYSDGRAKRVNLVTTEDVPDVTYECGDINIMGKRGEEIAALSTDKMAIMTNDRKSVCMYDPKTGEEISSFRSAVFENWRQALQSIALSPEGNTLALGTKDGNVCLLDASTGELKHKIKAGRSMDYYESGPSIKSIIFSSNHSMLVVPSCGEAKLYDVLTGNNILEFKLEDPKSGVFSSDGKFVIVAAQHDGGRVMIAEQLTPGAVQRAHDPSACMIQ